ncbi:MAG TPA: hypothetical protein VFD31_00870 [Thermoleophilaceae bacterium]|nr:hypothetical protein [Thermoleophilaceae bacterium]
MFLFAVLAFPALAQASPDNVLRDCNADESIDEKHSDADKRAALKKMPGEMREYTDCEQVIAASIGSGKKKAESSGGGGSGFGEDDGAGGGIDPDANGDGVVSPAEREAANKRKRQLAQADTERQLGDRQTDSLKAGAVDGSDTANGLSLPAVLALVALLLLTLGAGLYVLWRRNPELLRRVPIPFRSR